VQPVGPDQIPGPDAAGHHAGFVLSDVAHRAVQDRNAGRLDGGPKMIMQDGSAHAPAGAAAEVRADRVPFVAVGDPGDRRTRGVDAKPMQRHQRARHQPLAARLVERAGAALAHHDVQPGLGETQRGGQPGGAAADDQHIKHRPVRVRAARPPRLGSAP
jgi:hypothetical protein